MRVDKLFFLVKFKKMAVEVCEMYTEKIFRKKCSKENLVLEIMKKQTKIS